MTPTRVFISYAHETADHDEAVRSLWVLLRSCGIDAKLDRPAAERRQDWPLWMLHQLRQADYALVVVSPAYRRRAEGDAAADEGRGVQFEAALVREELYRDRTRAMAKLLPVLLPGRSTDDIPAFLGPTTATHYQLTDLTVAGVEPLLRVLTGQPYEVEPPLGPVPVLPPRQAELPRLASSAWVGLRHELQLVVALEGGRVSCRAVLAGTTLGEQVAPLPYGLDRVWTVLGGPPLDADARLAEVGHRLQAALLDEATTRHLTELVDESPWGTVVEIVVVADGPALGLPYELLRLPDRRLLATVPGVRLRRQIAGLERDATPPLAGPLKLLLAVAAPEETRTPNPPLDVEAEMQAILDAVGGVGGRGEAQVTILELGALGEISKALQEDQYHALHLSAHGSMVGIELEDEDGNPVPVNAARFVAELRAGGRPLPLLVLSSCAGAAGAANGLAATLVRHGADRVVAMQASVTDQYATRLAREFYQQLATGTDRGVAGALAEARRRVDDDRLEAQRTGGIPQRPEYGVVTLLAADGDPPLWDPNAPAVPLARPTRAPTGTEVRALRIGELIGRRRQLRTALFALRGGRAAIETFGMLSGVLLTGVGGIGKTALAGRIAARLAEDGWRIAVHEGRWNPPALTKAVADALAGDPRLSEAQERLTDPRIDDTAKLTLVAQLLGQMRLLLVFDDFEQNLTPGGSAYNDRGFADVVAMLCEAADIGRLLVTSRYPLPDRDDLLRIHLPPLSTSELGRLLLRLPALRELKPADRQALVATIGGHPRLIEFVDALLRQGRGNLREVTGRLRRLAGRLGFDLTGQRPLTQAVEEAVLLGSRDIFLGELLDALTADDRELLLQAAVSTLPLSTEDLTVARWGASPTVEQQADVAVAVERLVDLTLLSLAGDGQVVVHAWIADALGPHQQEDRLDERHRRAADMRLGRIRAGRGGFGDLVEIGRHLAATRQFDQLLQFAQAASTSLGGQLGEQSVAAFLGQITPLIPHETDGYLPLADREMQALLNTGSVAAALERANGMAAIVQQRLEADPSNVPAQHDLSVSYARLGDLMVAVGNLGEAERFHRDSLAIRERLVQADPSNRGAQRDLGSVFDRLGSLMVAVGNLGEAERFHRDSLTIAERLVQADPSNVGAQRDLSIAYERLGDLMVAVGNLGEAEQLYREGLGRIEVAADEDEPIIKSIREKLGALEGKKE